MMVSGNQGLSKSHLSPTYVFKATKGNDLDPHLSETFAPIVVGDDDDDDDNDDDLAAVGTNNESHPNHNEAGEPNDSFAWTWEQIEGK